MTRSTHLATTSLLATWLIAGPPAFAADTTEPFDEGALNMELHTGADGLGLDRGDTSFSGETLLGFGIVERISAYARGAAATDDRLEEGEGEAALGLFGTPLDTDHIDIDLGLDLGWTPGAALIRPGAELNLDVAPNLALAGVYLRGEEAVVTRQEPAEPALEEASVAPAEGAASGGSELALTTLVTLGTYWSLLPGHQLLLEADAGVAHRPAANEESFDFGGVALGYNVLIHEAVELITHVMVDVPLRADERVAAGIRLGLIGTAELLRVEEAPRGDRQARNAPRLR